MIIQQYCSANTSRNQLPFGFNKIQWRYKSINLDLGGGKFHKATKFLQKYGVDNYVYDPFHFSKEHNTSVLKYFYSTGTIFNVLNVIKEKKVRIELLDIAHCRCGIVYITICEGDRSRIGKPTHHGWQEHKPLGEYLNEIKEVFTNITIKDNIFTCM